MRNSTPRISIHPVTLKEEDYVRFCAMPCAKVSRPVRTQAAINHDRAGATRKVGK